MINGERLYLPNGHKSITAELFSDFAINHTFTSKYCNIVIVISNTKYCIWYNPYKMPNADVYANNTITNYGLIKYDVQYWLLCVNQSLQHGKLKKNLY